MKLYTSLLFILSLFSHDANGITFEEFRQSLTDLHAYKSEVDTILNVDVERVQTYLARIEEGLATFEFDHRNYAIVLQVQMDAAQLIVRKQHFLDQPTDVSYLQKLLDKLEQLDEVSDTDLKDLYYTAGHVAAHDLDNFSLAHRYWERCAFEGHAGCMNILAGAYESGNFTVQQDLSRAVFWHKKTFESGTGWGCAGFFSGLRLAIITASFGESSSVVAHWLEQSSKLRQQLVEKVQSPGMCDDYDEYLWRYVLEGFDKQWLDKLTTVEIDSEDVTSTGIENWIRGFATANRLNDLQLSLSQMYDDYRRCSAAEQFAFKVQHDAIELKSILNYVQSLDVEMCGSELATVQRLISNLD